MKIINFECDKNLSQYVDSMLFDSNTIIASMTCEINEHQINIDLMTRGYVNVEYKGDTYRYPSEFPQELKIKIKENPNWWDDEDVYIDENNWFEYIYDDTINGKTYSDGIVFEDDLSKYSVEQVKDDMVEVCKWIVNE